MLLALTHITTISDMSCDFIGTDNTSHLFQTCRVIGTGNMSQLFQTRPTKCYWSDIFLLFLGSAALVAAVALPT